MPRLPVRSLRWRFAFWFGLFFTVMAVGNRYLHFLLAVDLLARDVDAQLWSRLADLKTQHRYAPQTLVAPGMGLADEILPDVRRATDRKPSLVLRFVMPAESRSDLAAPSFPWFGGVWRPDGSAIATHDLPPTVSWDPGWGDRLDRIWNTADRSARLAATAGDDGAILVVGTPLADVIQAARQTVRFEATTLVAVLLPTLAIAWLLLSRLLMPLGGITETARRIRAGHFEERMDVAGVDAEVAHQVLNPVHAIMLETDVSMQRQRPREELEHTVATVHDLAARIEALCESLLTYARAQAIEPADLKPVDIEPIISAAVDRVSAISTARGIVVEVAVTSAVVRGGSEPLEEVFVNLLANAIEHSPPTTRVTIESAVAADRCIVAVVDHGAGVAAADVPRLFSRYFRGDRPSLPDQGHGLGLAICKGIVEQHGGSIDYRDTPGGGATFEVRLPRAESFS